MKSDVAQGLVQGLVWRARAAGIRVGIAEMEQALAVLSLQEEWDSAQLATLLLPIFAKRQDQRKTLLRLIDELLQRPLEEEIQKLVKPPGGPIIKPQALQPLRPVGRFTLIRLWLTEIATRLISAKWLPIAVWSIAAILFVAAFVLVFADLSRFLLDKLALLVRAFSGVLVDPLGNDLIAKGNDEDALQIALFFRHSIASALVATGAVAVLLGLRLKRRGRRPDPNNPIAPPEQREKGDGSVFRTGSLGGRAQAFLDQALASEITEIIAYRPTDDVRSDLDLRATLEQRVRGDMDSLVFERRKELPVVIILGDVATGARYWNTLAVEFQSALEKRGLVVEVVPYTGSFERQIWSGPHSGSTAEAVLEAIAERSGWMLTTVFGDLKRISPRDIATLAALREHGPVLTFDYVDQRLWDNRHATFESLGLGPHPATGFALRQALATAFAPDRGATRVLTARNQSAPEFYHLSTQHTDWACACALIEPISFSLAEKLRKVYPALADRSEALAFSLLAALPGSWVGREGLQFSPEIRRELLSRAADIPRDLQVAFLAVFDEAFGQEPASTTAAELWRYSRAQAELFTFRNSRALQDLADIRADGIIDPTIFADLVGRLRQPGQDFETGTIVLPRASPIAARQGLFAMPQSGNFKGEPVYALWSLGLAEIRVRIGSGANPLAAFFPEGRTFLLVDEATPDAFTRVDAIRGSREMIAQTSPSLGLANFTAVNLFSAGQGGVLTQPDGQLTALLEREGLSFEMALSSMDVDAALGSYPLVAVGPNTELVACAAKRSQTVLIVSPSGDTRPVRISVPGEVTALAFSQTGKILCGDANGNVYEFAAGDVEPAFTSDPSTIRPIAGFNSEITALTDFNTTDTSPRVIIAALANGVVATTDDQNHKMTFDALSWRAKSLTVFPDRKAALVDGLEAGISVAVIGERGEFDILGIQEASLPTTGFRPSSLIDRGIDPTRDGLAVFSISPERRRVIVRSGFYLEVRPLIYDLPEPEESAQSALPAPSASINEVPSSEPAA
jgi:hypothetical protein